MKKVRFDLSKNKIYYHNYNNSQPDNNSQSDNNYKSNNNQFNNIIRKFKMYIEKLFKKKYKIWLIPLILSIIMLLKLLLKL